MTTNLAGASPVDQPVKPLPPERSAFIEWLRAYAGGGEHWRGNVLMGEHDIALALWKDRQREIDRLQAKFSALQAALVKVLDTREKEAKAHLAFQTASDNYASGASREGRQHLAAMTAASNAEKEARLLLATLKTLNAIAEPPRAGKDRR